MRQIIDKIVNALTKATAALLNVLIVIMVIAMFTQVVSRWLNFSVSWTEETTRFACAWLIFSGVSLLANKDELINVTVLDTILKGKALTALYLIRRLVYIGYSLFIIKFGMDATAAVAIQTSPNMFIPMNFIYICIPIGSLLSAFYLTVNAVRLKKPEGGETID